MSLLNIIPDNSIPLRNRGRFVEPVTEPAPLLTDSPRALRSLASIVENGLCHRCGSCIGICPTKVLSAEVEGYPIVANLSACTDCNLCVRVCPGDEFNGEAVSQQMFGKSHDMDDVYGTFISGYLSHANDTSIRKISTSGGFVSALIISLLESGKIDGAAMVKADPAIPYAGIPFIARTREDVLSCMKSKYAISPTNVSFNEIMNTDGRYALVGLPCQIHGYHKAAALDKRLAERVVLTIALLCHAAVELEPLKALYDGLGEMRGEIKSFMYRHGKHPGRVAVELNDGSERGVMFPNKRGYQPTATEILNILYRLYTPERCLTCYDATGEFADISAGDPWMPRPFDDINFRDGWTYTLSRTARGEEALQYAVSRGDVTVRALTPEVSRTSNRHMGREKRSRAFRILETKRSHQEPIPDYSAEIPKLDPVHKIKVEINLLTHVFCFMPRARRYALKFCSSNVGYSILRLHSKRRLLREARRDFTAKVKRRIKRVFG